MAKLACLARVRRLKDSPAIVIDTIISKLAPTLTLNPKILLTAEQPNTWGPGGGIEKDKEAGGNDEHLTNSLGLYISKCVTTQCSGNSKDEQPYDHTSSTNNERNASSKSLQDVQTKEGASKIDTSENNLNNKWISQVDCVENSGSIVDCAKKKQISR